MSSVATSNLHPCDGTGSNNDSQGQIEQILHHPLFAAVLGTHLFQHTNLPPQVNDPQQQSQDQMMEDDSKETMLMKMIAQKKENERRNIEDLLTDPNSSVNVVADHYYASQKYYKKPGTQSPFNGMEDENQHEQYSEGITHFLIKQSALHALQKVELDMMHTAVDEYIENLRSALQITPPDSESASYLKTQQQMLMNTTPTSPTLDPRMVQQIQQHHAATGQLPQPSDNFDPIQSFPGPPLPPSTFTGKKPEEVISELKRKYSGQVLQVAQNKKKKKNFQKDTSEILNMWFFSNLHDPYPSDEVKKMLAQQTNLSLSQVNNWFGNKRIRYKRKMLEQNRRAAASQGLDVNEVQTPTRSRKSRGRNNRAESSDGDSTPSTPTVPPQMSTQQPMYQQGGQNPYYAVPQNRIPPPMNSIFVNPQQPMDAYQQQQHMRTQQQQMGYQYFEQ